MQFSLGWNRAGAQTPASISSSRLQDRNFTGMVYNCALYSLEGLLIMTAFQPWMILHFWFAAIRIDSSLFDSAICDGASNWVLFRKIYAPIVRPYVMIAAFLSIAESWNLLEQPMTFLQSKERYPLSMILMQLSTDNAELKNVLCLLLQFRMRLILMYCCDLC